MLKRLLVGAVALGLVALLLVSMLIVQWLDKSMAPQLKTSIVFELQAGDSLASVSRRLFHEGLLDYPKLFRLYGRATSQTNIKLGEYRLSADDTPRSFLQKLISGDVEYRSFVLIEGHTLQQTLTRLRQAEALVQTLPVMETRESTQQLWLALGSEPLNETAKNPEGLLFPDTYFYSKGNSDVDILRQAYLRMQNVLADEWEQRSENLPYQTPYEALIMASIVERETGVAYERGEIAGVFVRRLQKNMRLQTDPTVIYGMGDRYQGDIRRKDLKEATDYNTYVIKGLPPTPIALAGREAIHAALHPKAGSSLYFVAKGDGTHYFSSTLEEHTKAVRQYQLVKRAKDYRSAPPKP